MSKNRRFSAEKKIAVLREHLENQVPVSQLADTHDITPSQIYQWKKQLFEGAFQVFKPAAKSGKQDREIKSLKQKLVDRDSVIS